MAAKPATGSANPGRARISLEGSRVRQRRRRSAATAEPIGSVRLAFPVEGLLLRTSSLQSEVAALRGRVSAVRSRPARREYCDMLDVVDRGALRLERLLERALHEADAGRSAKRLSRQLTELEEHLDRIRRVFEGRASIAARFDAGTEIETPDDLPSPGLAPPPGAAG